MRIVTNLASYFSQQGVGNLGDNKRLHVDAGLRLDYFRFDVDDRIDSSHSGLQGASRFRPKANVGLSLHRIVIPVTL
jgi:hypothetical protein